MRDLDEKFKAAKKIYDRGGAPLDEIGEVTQHALQLLKSAKSTRLPSSSTGSKRYSIFEAGRALSRPYLPSLFESKASAFSKAWTGLVRAIDPVDHVIKVDEAAANATLYTAIQSFCLCYDLWKPSSRKTPGTMFEVMLGSLLTRLLPGHQRTKHVPLPDEESLSTDIVMASGANEKSLVFPVKITTRERIVQAFAHQRILDSVYGVGRYQSILVCVSEMQRDQENTANEICVPGTIRLFQRHLAQLLGICYLDPPVRYLQADLTAHVSIGSLGKLVTQDLKEISRS